jgi:AraC-like DNA-binding protein
MPAAKNSSTVQQLFDAALGHSGRHAGADGLVSTPVPGLRMMRMHTRSGPMRSLYRPLVCLVLQGSKALMAGAHERVIRAGQAIIVGVDLPVCGRILRATRAEPYLAVAVELDIALLHSISLRLPGVDSLPEDVEPLLTGKLHDEIADCALRMLRLIGKPEAIPFLLPALQQELHYWLLSGPQGPALRALCTPSASARRIAAAVKMLRQNYRASISVNELAAATHLSPAAFHRHFKAVTSLSPVQFQKQLRLIEARRLLVADGFNASRAAFDVGYESASQFTREYKRMFGDTPRRDRAGAAARTAVRDTLGW